MPRTRASSSTRSRSAIRRRPARTSSTRQALKEVAGTTGGGFFRALDRDQLSEIYRRLDEIETRRIDTVSFRPRRDMYWIPLALGLSDLHGGRGASARAALALARYSRGSLDMIDALASFHFLRPALAAAPAAGARDLVLPRSPFGRGSSSGDPCSIQNSCSFCSTATTPARLLRLGTCSSRRGSFADRRGGPGLAARAVAFRRREACGRGRAARHTLDADSRSRSDAARPRAPEALRSLQLRRRSFDGPRRLCRIAASRPAADRQTPTSWLRCRRRFRRRSCRRRVTTCHRRSRWRRASSRGRTRRIDPRRGRCGGRGTGRALEGASRSGHLPCRPSIRRSAPGACGCRFGAECPRRRDDDRSVRH